MRRKCCVPSCNASTKCCICQLNLSYFKIPRDPSIIKKWEQSLGFQVQPLQPRDRVCSTHFKKNDIVTKRFVSLKRPSTNSKMIFEITKLDRDAVPSTLRQDMTPCNHSRNKRSTIKCDSKRSRSISTSVGSEAVTSESDEDSDDSSNVTIAKNEKNEAQLTRKDYCTVVKNLVNRSKRRHVRALGNLRIKWLEKKKKLERDICLLEEMICELRGARGERATLDSV